MRFGLSILAAVLAVLSMIHSFSRDMENERLRSELANTTSRELKLEGTILETQTELNSLAAIIQSHNRSLDSAAVAFNKLVFIERNLMDRVLVMEREVSERECRPPYCAPVTLEGEK